ncbi:MAG: DUF3592 domain-containing protein [Nitrospirae bacterium]|nr:MAG: DUF3592 domain-containing protein [Nitrospirota bacterium]
MEKKGSFLLPLTRAQRFFVIVVGLVFIGAAIYGYRDTFSFAENLKETQGIVVGVQKERRSDAKGTWYTTYRPVVEFETGGKKYRFLATVSSPGYRNAEGRAVRVLYDPENPQNARLAEEELTYFYLLFGICGALAVLFGLKAPLKEG